VGAGNAQTRIDESKEAEYNRRFDGECISRVIAAECPRRVSCGSISVVTLELIDPKLMKNT
jgi:hypothetical protein